NCAGAPTTIGWSTSPAPTGCSDTSSTSASPRRCLTRCAARWSFTNTESEPTEHGSRHLKAKSLEFSPSDTDNRRLANLCGPVDQNIRQIEEAFDVRIARRGDSFSIEGTAAGAKRAQAALEHFW